MKRSLPIAIALIAFAGPAAAEDADPEVVSGYVQAQYDHNQASEDERLQGGAPSNQDRFHVRRARLRVDKQWDWAVASIEIDASTTRGAAIGLRRAEAGVRFDQGETSLLLVAGVTDIPFGWELGLERSRNRIFLERSSASLAFFPGEGDVGARAAASYGPFRIGLAFMNGEPADAAHVGRDFNKSKDLVVRIGAEAKPTADLEVGGGVSFLKGKGFHPGTDATKPTIEWRDLNENGAVDLGETTGVPGFAATPSANFDRWAVGADLRFALRTALGLSRLYGEVYLASNLDRGLFVADPISAGTDSRELGAYVAGVQELGKWLFFGARVDVYDPNSDFLDKRQGKLVPTKQTITTFSPLVGLSLGGHGRFVVQYDLVRDHLARDVRGVPVDAKNDQLSFRVQVDL